MDNLDGLTLLTIQCQYGDGRECDEDIEWHMLYHGCNQEVLCEKHATEYLSHLIYHLVHSGAVCCSACGEAFHSPEEFVKVRPV